MCINRTVYVVFANEDHLVQEICNRAYLEACGSSHAQLRTANSANGVLDHARMYGEKVHFYLLDDKITSNDRLLGLIAQLHELSPGARVVVRCRTRPCAPVATEGSKQLEFDTLDKETSAEGLVGKLRNLMANVDRPYKVFHQAKESPMDERKAPGDKEHVRLPAAV